jgi:hypothetical protein
MFRLISKLLQKTREVGSFVGTFRTQDSAFAFRMLTGFPGTVNRTHPASIDPCLVDPNAPPLYYGIGVVVDSVSQGVRPIVAGDSALTAIYGVTVRPYPIQVASATNYGAQSFGSATPPPNTPIDVLKSGYMLVYVNNFAVNNSSKDSAVDIWFAATAAPHVQGGFEAAHTGGSSLTLAQGQTYFNGAAGPDGVAELAFNL